jgi:hypothetical protein
MPTVYLPEFGLSDSRRGLCDAVQLMGLHSMLIMQCLELLVITDGKGKMHDLLPETTKNIPDKYIEPCFEIAKEIIERFTIKSYPDFLAIRHIMRGLYSQVAFINGTEYVLNGDRWYSRTWVKHKIKEPKHDFGILLYLDNTKGDSGLAIAGGGTEFKALKYGTVMQRNTNRMKMEYAKNMRAYTEQDRVESKINLLKIYNKFDLFNKAERSQAVVLAAVEALQLARQIVYQNPCTPGDIQFHQRNGVPELLHYIEVGVMQMRHREAAVRPALDSVMINGLAEKCTTKKVGAEIAAVLTAFYYTPEKKTRKPALKKDPAKSTGANTVKSNKK